MVVDVLNALQVVITQIVSNFYQVINAIKMRVAIFIVVSVDYVFHD